jgi:DNA polymerase-3 subunit epsilon
MFFFSRFLSINQQQQSLLKKINDEGVRHYLQTALPGRNDLLSDVEYLALDFETTGMNAQNEAILSVGYTIIRQQAIQLKENGHQIIKVNRPISDESTVIHKITEERAATGEHLHDVLQVLLKKMTGRVLLVHYAEIEKTFLNYAFKQIFGYQLPFLIVDTFSIEYNYLKNTNQAISKHQLRLFNLRDQYGLPRYNAHNALEDAIATAELFLAQIENRQNKRNRLKLRDVLL